MSYLIEFPMIKITTNEIYSGKHWTVRKRNKESYLWIVRGCRNIPTIKDYPVKLKFNFYFKSRPLDSSNCSYMGKLIEDCLVELGYIKDDSIKYISSVTYQSHKSDKNKIVLQII